MKKSYIIFISMVAVVVLIISAFLVKGLLIPSNHLISEKIISKETQNVNVNGSANTIADKSKSEEQNQYFLSNSNKNLALIISLIVTLISLITSLYLYYWRSLLISNLKYLVPEKFAKEIRLQTNHFQQLTEISNKVLENSLSQNENINEQINVQNQNFLKLQKNLDERDKLIKRYQEGYDQELFKNYINRFFRIYNQLILNNEKLFVEDKFKAKFNLLFQDAFEECNVEIFYPKIGTDFIEDGNELEDTPKIIFTSEKNENNKVVEIISPGLRSLNKELENKIIIKSKVSIHKFKEI